MFKDYNYKLYLNELDRVFPHKNILTITDIVKYDGRSRNTVLKYYPELKKMKGGISKVRFSMIMAKRSGGLT